VASHHERYQIIERLDAGGMAEVFKANAVSMEGFEKLVAIKKVLPGLTEDDRFLRMFLDEARLSLFLNHANIVQVFDIGTGADGAYFIVMQFIDGANLKKITGTLAERGSKLPLELAVFIAMDVCKGLAYAHNKRSTDGQPLGIVHRDISPPNILISREGEVKIMDFGLAKATGNLEKTDPGVVKGKFGYLSPEAAHGEEVDLRTDIFAVGIVLWEMLAGRRLFHGESDYETLHLVRKAEVPSLRSFNPDVPAELEAIVRKSLAQDKLQRFSSCQEFGSVLTQFLFGRGLTVTSYDLSALVNRVVGAERRAPRAGEPSAIDLVVQHEINKFVSLEDGGEAEPGLGGGLFAEEAGDGGAGMNDMWGGVFDEVVPDIKIDHIPSGGTKRLERLDRASMEAAASAPAASPAPSSGRSGPSANPSASAPAAVEPGSSGAAGRSGQGTGGRATANPVSQPGNSPTASGAAAVEEGGASRRLWIVFAALLLLVVAGIGYLMLAILSP